MLQRANFLLPCDGYISFRLLRTVWNRHCVLCCRQLYKTGLMRLDSQTCLVLGHRRATGPLKIERYITFFSFFPVFLSCFLCFALLFFFHFFHSLSKSGRTVFLWLLSYQESKVLVLEQNVSRTTRNWTELLWQLPAVGFQSVSLKHENVNF